MTYVVIFRSRRSEENPELYYELNSHLAQKIQALPGYISHFGARDPQTREGVTVVYFDSLDAIEAWRRDDEHLHAKGLAKTHFYEHYSIDIAEVRDSYAWSLASPS